MAKPRIFVSSTYYDLRHIRRSLEAFIDSLGYEAVLFESGDIPFKHDAPLDESCYVEIKSCHILVLIIGGRFGSSSSDAAPPEGEEDKFYKHYNSITEKEYKTARELDIPIFIFVEKNVLSEYETFKENRENTSVKYAHVQNINVFRLIDDIYAQSRNNLLREFDNFDDISSWLKLQWAGLFADFLAKKSEKTSLKDMASQMSSLSSLTGVLKEYTEALMRKVQPQDFEALIRSQERRLITQRSHAFSREPMIRFIRDESEEPLSSARLYRSFIESESLEDFLSRARVSDDFMNRFMLEHEDAARKDYFELVEKYKEPTDEAESDGEGEDAG